MSERRSSSSDAGASKGRDIALAVIAAMAFATSSPLAEVAVDIPPLIVAAGRTGLAALVLVSVAPWRIVAALRALAPRHRHAVVLAGALLAGHFGLFLAGLAATSLPAAVALVSLEPIAVVLAAFVAFGLRPSRAELIGLALATLGAIVVATGAGEGEHRLSGDLMVVLAVALYGAYVAVARGLRDALPALPYAAAVYGTATLILLPVALARAALGISSPAGASVAAVVALALIPTLIGHSFVQLAARRAPPVLVALISPGETLGSLAIGALAMDAAPSLREGAGAALIVAGATIAVALQSRTATTGA